MPSITPGSRVLVTGATGYVGGMIAKAFKDAGYVVRAAVRDPKDVKKVGFLQELGVELARVPDLLSDEGWDDAMKDVEGVAHAASPVILDGSMPEDLMIRTAVEGVERALRAAARSRTVKRVVVTSSMAAVLGLQKQKDPNHLWDVEDYNDDPNTPPYYKSKTAAEKRTWELAEEFKHLFSVTTVVPSLVVGEFLPGMAIASSLALTQGFINGGQGPEGPWAVVHIRDVTDAHVAALERKEAEGQRYLATSRDDFSSYEIGEAIVAAAPDLAGIVNLPQWRARLDPKLVIHKPSSNNAPLAQLLGVKDLRPLAEAVKDIIASFREVGVIPPLPQ